MYLLLMEPLIFNEDVRQQYENKEIVHFWQFAYATASLQEVACSIDAPADILNIIIDNLRAEIQYFRWDNPA